MAGPHGLLEEARSRSADQDASADILTGTDRCKPYYLGHQQPSEVHTRLSASRYKAFRPCTPALG